MTHSAVAAGIDIGSNTISCCKIEKTEGGTTKVQKDISIPVRLSEGLSHEGCLKKEAVMRSIMALERIYSDFELSSCEFRAAGTAVLRMTSHPGDFLDLADEVLGRPVEVISGMMEAELTRLGAILNLVFSGNPVVVDLGGQSTEISAKRTDGGWDTCSMPLGVVSIKERFFLGDSISKGEVEQARFYINEILEKESLSVQEGLPVCVGGTPTTLSLVIQGCSKWQREKVHGDEILLVELKKWLTRMCAISKEERSQTYGISPFRADVFPAGLLALDCIVRYLGADRFVVSANGLRMGLAMSVLEMI